MLENAGEDLVEVLEDLIDGMVENHINAWYSRYENKSIEEIKVDLYVNHDLSIEIELVEEKLGRELDADEYGLVEMYFNENVLDVFRRGEVHLILY